MESLQSKDLRIGNYVSGDINQLIVVNVDNLGVHVTLKELWFKPIPLTEEWLIRFSFEYLRRKDGTLGVYSNGKMNLILSNSGNVYTMKNKLIPYVHTLQNYYYFTLLTGQELTIKTEQQ